MSRSTVSARWAFVGLVCLLGWAQATRAELKAGAALVDVTPVQFPVLVNGGMLSRSADKVKTPVHARALVLDDGETRMAIVVVDSCMMPRPLLDEAKQLAASRTKIAPDHMLISATHTHTAPACMGCLGTDADPEYVPYLRLKLAEAIAAAESNLRPARYGWAVADANEYTALRRWIRRPDRIEVDPFGNRTVRANMHAGRVWDDVTGESGPEDPDLSLLALQGMDGRPIAVLANFSMHYFGDTPISADYFGLFCTAFQQHVGQESTVEGPPFVAIMSHGCSGDIWRRDYTKPVPGPGQDHTIDSYTQGLLEIALRAFRGIKYKDDGTLAMRETRLHLNYRTPDQQRLEWAQRIVAAMGDRPPKDTTEVYAREQVILHERQSTDVVVQALRIGDVAIATTPTETYALTGLKIKRQSPFPQTMVIELANGGDGYIPPPEQHLLGGYNTWPARSAGLEVQAEPKITEAALELLEHVCGTSRRSAALPVGPAVRQILDLRPAAYWRLDEMAGPRALDYSGHHRDAYYEPGVVFFLEGPNAQAYCGAREPNRAAHFAGGRLESRIADLRNDYSVAFWFWNGLPPDAREMAGWLFSRGYNHGLHPQSEHLGLGGTMHSGRLVYQYGSQADQQSVGKTEIARWTWNHVCFVRSDDRVRVYLNGAKDPEIDARVPAEFPRTFDQLYFGGRCDHDSTWEGRLDEIVVFDRPLEEDEVARLWPATRP